MRLLNSNLLVVLTLSGVFAAPSKSESKGGVTIQRAGAGTRVKGSYIVTLKATANKTACITSAEKNKAKLTHGNWNSKVFHGFAGNFSDDAITALSHNPGVAAIEEDAFVYASATTTQTNATWGLQRISQRSTLVNQNPTVKFSYKYDQRAGTGVDIYVVDTGIYTANQEFSGRASWGKTFGGYANADGNGHGTHVAGIAIGKTYGVAKKARAYAVKVLGDDGSGAVSDVISGITWAVSRANSTGRPSVINLSLGGSISQALDAAVNAAADKGVHVSVAAGNDNVDAGNSSPARATGVTAVGATTISNTRASFSNYGTVVDIFAPGQYVLSSWIGSKNATEYLSGTSMASPHVAGLIAYYISLKGNTKPATLRNALQSQATSGKIPNLPSGTKNLIANNGIGRN